MKQLLTEWRRFLKENKEQESITEIKASSIKEAGSIIGKKLKSSISEEIESDKISDLLEKFDDWFQKGNELSKKETPKAYEFITGIAEGAGVSVDNLFGTWYEELIYAKEEDKSKLKDEGCTDVIIKNNGNVMIGHTNDVSPQYKGRLFKLEIKNEPTIFIVLTSGAPSAGLNSNGLIFSGNQVDANDTKPGIPRMMCFMEALFSKTLKEAERVFLHKDRASSFNNIVSDENGEIMSLEASAEDHKKKKHKNNSIDVHTNHFLHLTSKEARVDDSYERSVKRFDRAIEEAEQAGKEMSIDDMKEIMSSHGDGGLCRHPNSPTDVADVKTNFSIIFLPTKRKFLFATGYPCKADYKEYEY
jgi:hypothetical protein